MENETNFIHFGCWSEGSYGENNPMTYMLNTLKSFTETNKVDFISVAGDNYYKLKNKKDKSKIFYKNDLYNAFDNLPNIPIYVLMGNHELESNNEDDKTLYIRENEDKLVKATDENTHNCIVLYEELNLLKENPHFLLDNLLDPIILHKIINDNTVIIMIDTTMYDLDVNDNDIKCYKLLLHNFGIYDTQYTHGFNEILFNSQNERENPFTYSTTIIEDMNNEELLYFVKKYQEFRINNLIKNLQKDNIKNIIIIGHHPIINIKVKKDKNKIIQLNIYDLFYNTIFQPFKKSNINYYYLCADLHNYQEGVIELQEVNNTDSENTMKINQYIVGTGGAHSDEPYLLKPDRNDNTFSETMNKYIIQYDVINSFQSYGFLNCKLVKDELSFCFINSDNETNKEMHGGKLKRKTKKRKSKLTKRKSKRRKLSKKKSKKRRKSKKN